jgi:hypothetical protein
MSYSLNDRFSIDTATATARLDGNLQLRNYLSYKTNNNTINLSGYVTPFKYDLKNISDIVIGYSNLFSSNIHVSRAIGNPYTSLVNGKDKLDMLVDITNDNNISVQLAFPTSISQVTSIPALTKRRDLFTFTIEDTLVSVTTAFSFSYYDNYCKKIFRGANENLYQLYTKPDAKGSSILSMYNSIGNLTSPLNSNITSSYKHYRFIPDPNVNLCMNDFVVINTSNVIITGFCSTGTIGLKVSMDPNFNQLSSYDTISTDSIMPINNQYGIFVMNIDTRLDKIQWANYIVGTLNNSELNKESKIVGTSENKIVVGAYIHTENQLIKIYSRNVDVSQNVSYVQTSTIIQGTDQNNTDQLILVKFYTSGVIDRVARTIITSYQYNKEPYYTNPATASFYELSAQLNGNVTMYLRNDKITNYKIYGADGSYKTGVNYKNIIVRYNNLLIPLWVTNILSINDGFAVDSSITINQDRILVQSINNLTSNVNIYNSDNSIQTVIAQDATKNAITNIIYNSDGSVFNTSYLLVSSASFTNTYSVGLVRESDFYIRSTNSYNTNYIYVDSFESRNTVDVAKNSFNLDIFMQNNTKLNKLFRIGDTLDTTIIDTQKLIVNGDLALTGKVTSDFFLNSDNNVLRNNLQLKSKRLVRQLTSNTDTVSFIYEGVYKLEPNDVELFLNGYKLCYQNSNSYDYLVNYDVYQTSNSRFTIKLAETAYYGDIMDITIWPSYYPEYANLQPGYVLQNVVTDFWTQGPLNIYYTGAIGVGTTFAHSTADIEGDICITGNLYHRTGNTLSLFKESPFIPIEDAIENNFYLPDNAAIGIGTTFPTQSLHLLNKNILITGSGALYTGNIGIGTTFLIKPFHLEQDAYINGNIGIGTTRPRQRFDLESGNMILTTGNLGIGTAIPIRPVHITKQSYITGNIGINTTFPQQILDITSGNVVINSGNLGIGTYTPIAPFHITQTMYSSGNIGIGISNPRQILDITNGNVILNAGNLGVGTTNPISQLHIRGQTYIQGNIGIGTTIPRQALDIQDASILIMNGNVGIGSTLPAQQIDVNGTVQATYFKGNGSLLTNLPVGQWTINGTQMYYTSGNVGIGTSTPLSQFDVYGNVLLRNGNIYIPSTTSLVGNVGIGTYGYSTGLLLHTANTNPLKVLSSYPTSYPSSTGTFTNSQTVGISTSTNYTFSGAFYPPEYMTANSTNMTSTLYDSGTYIASGSSTASQYFNAFTSSSRWDSGTAAGNLYSAVDGTYVGGSSSLGGISGEWIKLQLANPIVITSYRLQSDQVLISTGKYTMIASAFKVLGSINNSTWTVLDTQSGFSGSLTTFNISNSIAYTYYAIVVTNVQPAGTNNYNTDLSRVIFYSSSTTVGFNTSTTIPIEFSRTNTNTINGGTYKVYLTNGGYSYYYSSVSINLAVTPATSSTSISLTYPTGTGLLNTASSTMLTTVNTFTNVSDAGTPFSVTLTFPNTGFPIYYYRIKGSSSPNLSPRVWKVYASPDNINFTPVDTRSGISWNASSYNTYFLPYGITVPYYRFDFYQNNSSTANALEIDKLIMYGSNTNTSLNLTHTSTLNTSPSGTLTVSTGNISAVNSSYINVYSGGILDMGYGNGLREENAGKIVYQNWTDGLDIIGAGSIAGSRKVTIFDNLYANGIVNAYSFTRLGGIRFADQPYGSAVGRHMVFIRNGDILGCGLNTWGQLGFGVVDNLPFSPRRIQWNPANITLPEKVISLCVSNLNTFFLTMDTNGTTYIYTIGHNGQGMIGNGTTTDQYTAYQVSLNTDGSAVTQPVSIFMANGWYANSGGRTLMYINAAGQLYTWGYRPDNAGTGYYTKPTLMPTAPNGGGWKGAVTDGYSIQAWTDDASGNALYAMGYNGRGALANGTTTNSLISTTGWVACLYNDGGSGTQITNISKVIIGGASSALSTYYALTKNGTLYAWGQNNLGSVGNGTVTTPVTLAYDLTAALSYNTVADVAAAGASTGNGNISVSVLTTSGNIYAWGQADTGYGLGNTTNYSSPQLVPIPSGYGTAAKIRGAGNLQVYFYIDINGNAYGVGRNNSVNLGIGNLGNQSSYKQVILQEPCIDIYPQFWYDGTTPLGTTYFQGASGRIYAAGRNTEYQCGEGSTVNYIYVPAEVLIPL